MPCTNSKASKPACTALRTMGFWPVTLLPAGNTANTKSDLAALFQSPADCLQGLNLGPAEKTARA